MIIKKLRNIINNVNSILRSSDEGNVQIRIDVSCKLQFFEK